MMRKNQNVLVITCCWKESKNKIEQLVSAIAHTQGKDTNQSTKCQETCLVVQTKPHIASIALMKLSSAIETISKVQSIVSSQTLPGMVEAPSDKTVLLLLLLTNRLQARDFYAVIVDEGEARIDYHRIEISSS